MQLGNQLNPIPKRIGNMTALNSRNAVVVPYLNLSIPQPRNQTAVIKASQRRVRLAGRPEILFNSKMNLHRPTLKPAPATFRQLRRFRHFLHSEQCPVKCARSILPIHGHGQLHMINRAERISPHIE
jgi:hypothetical protein